MKYIITLITVFIALSINAQQLEKQVISSTGSDVSAGGMQISQTIGEVAVETYTSGSFTLGQGFQQVEDAEDTTLIQEVDVVVNYTLYPNPASDNINIELELNADADLSIALVNVNGQVLDKTYATILQNEKYNTNFSLKSYTNGIYFLQFSDDKNRLVKTIKFNKF